jgi:hypothetical protein
MEEEESLAGTEAAGLGTADFDASSFSTNGSSF